MLALQFTLGGKITTDLRLGGKVVPLLFLTVLFSFRLLNSTCMQEVMS